MAKTSDSREVAIVGMGCRFAGDIETPEQFWEALRSKRELVHASPRLRSGSGRQLGPSRGGWLSRVEDFDAGFFGISPREAVCIDPQHRLLLEVGWEALEHAGIPASAFTGRPVGVFVGIASHDYEQLVTSGPSASAHAYTGTSAGFAAGRLSFALGVTGPSLSIDTGCSSSLVAMHYACESIMHGDCCLALAAGVNLILSPQSTLALSQLGALAPDGRCKTLDDAADGFARAEGAVVLVFKPLLDAMRDRDHIWGVVRSTCVNHDGRSKGLTVPNGTSQRQLLAHALERAGLTASDVDYVEMHGTGTPVGDPIEFEALTSVFGASDASPCVLGSVKTNLGHLEAAAGLTGVLKAAMALAHEQIPANLNFETPSRLIDLGSTPFVVPTQTVPWPRTSRRRYVGVSSFGLSGTNAHVILEEPPAGDEPQPEQLNPTWFALPVSAQDSRALCALAQRWTDQVRETADSQLATLCAAAAERRSHLRQRAVVLGRDQHELVSGLVNLANGERSSTAITGTVLASNELKTVFVFPGHGSQWVGMGRELLQSEPVFRDSILETQEAMARFVDWSLVRMLVDDSTRLARGDNDVVQPVLVAIEIALARLWRSWRIEPSAVIGHSMGEVAAAHVAGALTLEDAVRVICERSKVLRQVLGRGSMVLVELSLDQARRTIAGLEHAISIAVNNSSTTVVLSGDTHVLQQVVAELESRQVFCRWVRVDYASHSPQMDVLQPQLKELFAEIRPRAGTIPIYSTLLGKPCDGQSCDGAYWVRNLREPVLFASALELLVQTGHGFFVEVSPHPLLTTSIEQSLRDHQAEGLVVGSLRRDCAEPASLLESVARLHAAGHKVEWSRLTNVRPAAMPLPRYPWQRERFWSDADSSPVHVEPASGDTDTRQAMLGAEILLAGDSAHHYWELDVSLPRFPFLRGHRVAETCLLPATAYLELALTHGRKLLGERLRGVCDVSFDKPAILTEDEGRRVQVRITQTGVGDATFQIASRQRAAADWTIHVTGTFLVNGDPAESVLAERLDRVRERCSATLPVNEWYQKLAAIGLQYGPDFCVVRELHLGDAEALARVSLPHRMQAHDKLFHLHPAKLDGCLQVIAALLPGALEGTAPMRLPVKIEEFAMLGEGSGEDVWAHAIVRKTKEGELEGTVFLFDTNQRMTAYVRGLKLARVQDGATASAQFMHEPRWIQTDALPSTGSVEGKWLMLADQSSVAKGVAALLVQHGAHVVIAEYIDCDPIGGQTTQPDRYRAKDRTYLKQLFEAEFAQTRCRGVVYLWSGDQRVDDNTPVEDVAGLHQLGCMGVATLAQVIVDVGLHDAPPLYIITRGAQQLDEDSAPECLGMTALWGAARTFHSELPELRCTCIDLALNVYTSQAAQLLTELMHSRAEQVALREHARYVFRLDVCDTMRREERLLPFSGEAYRLEQKSPGTLSDFRLCRCARTEPAAHEIEIAIHAAGINFIDVMKALDVYPGGDDSAKALGWECSGVVAAVGSDVESFRVGDPVLAVAPGSFGSRVVTRADWVAHKPEWLTFEEAACVPLAFATAWHALRNLAGLDRGERILIHSASGGTGLAAVQLAQELGCEVFATAGNPEKREFLRSIGAAHVFDSRSLRFSDEILVATNGRGVDVVLNSLSGAAIDASLAVLAPDGRFVELGKTDIYADRPLASRWFKKRLTIQAVDLAGLADQRPERFAALFQTVVAELANRRLKPLPVKSYAAVKADDALREIAQARHVGKLALTFTDAPKELWSGSAVPKFRSDAWYLITGGSGAMGSALAEWLPARGAKHILLVSRSNPDANVKQMMEVLQTRGVDVRAQRADVSRVQEVHDVLRTIDGSGLPLCGIFHAAGVLEDKTVVNLDEPSLQRVLAPKVSGAWVLHRATTNRQLDYFVVYSSLAGLVGSPGQYSYNAANAGIDGLIRHRRARGLPGMSICWGPIASIGLAAANTRRRESVAWRGLVPIPIEQANACLGSAIALDKPQIVIADWNYRQFFEAMPQLSQIPSFEKLRSRTDKSHNAGRHQLLLSLQGLAAADRPGFLEDRLREEFAVVLRTDASRIERTTPIQALGLDSLMGLEIRNRIELATGLKLSTTIMWTYTNIAALSTFLLAQMFAHEVNHAPASELGRESAPEHSSRPALPASMQADASIQGIDTESIALLERELTRLATDGAATGN